jgi:hypothetical protein
MTKASATRFKERNDQMIKVYHIVVDKEKLRAIPREERGFLLSLGYSANQVSMLQKFLMFSSNREPSTETERILSAAQTQMILRLLIGVLHETWGLIKERFEGAPLGADYEARLDEGGRAALAKLKATFETSKLMLLIRNNFSFHLPNDKALEAAFNDACNDPNSDELWSLYFSQYGFNSHFLISDLMAVHGISLLIKEQGPISAQPRIMKEVVEGAENTFEFTKAFFAAAWLKNFGSTIDAKEIIQIADPPTVGSVSIPFFIDMDPSSISNL